MHRQYTGVRWRKNKRNPPKTTTKTEEEKHTHKKHFVLCRLGSFSCPHWLRYFALLLKPKDSYTFCGISGFYSTIGYAAVIFSAHLVAMKCKVFTTTSTFMYLAGNPADTFPPTSGKSQTQVRCTCTNI